MPGSPFDRDPRGEPPIRVQRVTANAGGPAIVGAVSQTEWVENREAVPSDQQTRHAPQPVPHGHVGRHSGGRRAEPVRSSALRARVPLCPWWWAAGRARWGVCVPTTYRAGGGGAVGGVGIAAVGAGRMRTRVRKDMGGQSRPATEASLAADWQRTTGRIGWIGLRWLGGRWRLRRNDRAFAGGRFRLGSADA
jgi:hypothetical protein